jgi:hypothetical protein
MPIEWVTKQKLEELTGFTTNQIRSKIQRGIWERGLHYAVVDGRTMLNVRRIEEWIIQKVSDQEAIGCRSATAQAENGSRKRSTSARLGLV